jgi:hypothetical protein
MCWEMGKVQYRVEALAGSDGVFQASACRAHAMLLAKVSASDANFKPLIGKRMLAFRLLGW